MKKCPQCDAEMQLIMFNGRMYYICEDCEIWETAAKQPTNENGGETQ